MVLREKQKIMLKWALLGGVILFVIGILIFVLSRTGNGGADHKNVGKTTCVIFGEGVPTTSEQPVARSLR